MNCDAERLAIAIRIRAERRVGQMLKETAASGERAKVGANRYAEKTSNVTTTTSPTLAKLGITRNQSSQWLRMADVPERDFERAISDPIVKPSTL